MITMRAGDRSTRYTPQHHCLVKLPADNRHVVYLMRRGNDYRVGCCAMRYAAGFGPATRMRQEKADAVWVLSCHRTRREALIAEAVTASRHSLPMTTFEPVNQETTDRGLDSFALGCIWSAIGDNRARAAAALSNAGRDILYPLFERNSTAASRRPIVTRACNLFDGMQVRVFTGETHARAWTPIEVGEEHYEGDVISLDVEEDHLYVGDGIVTHNCQAIYGFRGADSESLAQIAQTFGARRFPLSCTYRCPRLVVELAQVFVPHLRAREGAPDGTIQNGVTLSKIGEVPGAQPAIGWRPDDLVVCRNTAPLIAIAYQLIRAKTPCHVLGREIGTGLLSLVKKLKPRDLEDLGDNLDRYQRRETDRLKRTGADGKIEALDDKCETLRVFIDEAQSLGDMETTIRSLFDDDERQGRTTLSTIHRAKGSEAPRVIIVDPWRMPSRMASQPWQLEQERNLAYVAVTRAKESLVFANLGPSNNPAAMPPPQAFGLVSARAEVRGGVVVRISDRRPA